MAIAKFRTPMLAKLVESPPAGEWHYEIKFDGWRALAIKNAKEAQLWSRNEKLLTAKFPEVVHDARRLKAKSVVLDGEICAVDERGHSSFQLLQGHDMTEERPPIRFFAFDVLELDGRDLTRLILTERRAILQKLLKKPIGCIHFSESLGSEADPLLEQARKVGLEGLIGKRANSLYEVGARSGAWIKLKLTHEQEFVIGGYTDPEGSRLHFGGLIVGVYESKQLICTGRVGTGFDAKKLRDLYRRMRALRVDECPFANLPEKRKGRWGSGLTVADMARCHWVKPKMVCQVKFTEWTNDGGVRHPVYLGLREDKAAAKVVRETPA